MHIDTDSKKIDSLLTRGVEEVIHRESLREKLLSGKKLRIKLGIDPTSPNIHLGRSIPIRKLRDFQELGHQVVVIVGDFTGIIGDTSDKESERPMLTSTQIEDNKKSYFDQIGKILDAGAVEFRYNSEWFEKLTYREIGEHANLFSVSDFISRENIKKRLDGGKRISLREVLYPLMQGYDSVAVKADIEVGGIDQRFNMLAGRVLQPHFTQVPQDILMTQIINGTDGRKMSSSWGNTIQVTASAKDMYGKVMSMQDAEILTYFITCTRVPQEELLQIEGALKERGNPRDFKMKLAREITRLYHGDDGAILGEQYFIETFQKKEVPQDVLPIPVPYIEGLIRHDVVASKTELRRLLEAGGVKEATSGEKITVLPEAVQQPLVLKIGKRRFVKLMP